jgi:type VI secretion system protein ImpM
MGFGVFGKLPQKRDFVTFNVPRVTLEPFETWLQSAVAASRSELAGAWQEHYLVAPIWRFWIGGDILGATCAGSLVPSVDGIGRFFPLTILYCAESGEEIPPPPFAPMDDWYAAIETRLLGVLDEKAEVQVDRLTEGLRAPESDARPPEPRPLPVRRGRIWQEDGSAAGELLASLMAADYWASAAGKSFWWTNGGTARKPLVYVRNALPDPFFYVDMIKGGSG